MTWLDAFGWELGWFPLFVWQYAALLGLLAVLLVLTRPVRFLWRRTGHLYGSVLALAGFAASALLPAAHAGTHLSPMASELLFLAGMVGGWRTGVLGWLLMQLAAFRWELGVVPLAHLLETAVVACGGVFAHRWYGRFELADIGVRELLGMWGVRTATLLLSAALVPGLLFDAPSIGLQVLPDASTGTRLLGSLFNQTLAAPVALLFMACILAMFRLDAQDRRRQRTDWHNSRKDSLTHLPNRRALSEYLASNAQQSSPAKMAMICIGVNNHTQMLLAQGHGWGDKFLQRLATSVHEEPLRSLLGHVELRAFQFTDLCLVLVVKGITPSELDDTGLALRLHQELSLKMHGLAPGGPVPALTMTIATCDPLRHAEPSLALRDLGLFLNAQGTDARNLSFLHTSFAHVAQREVLLLGSLSDWIDANGPPMAYMPKCHLRTHAVLGAEALLRFRDANGQPVPPGQVLVLAARHKLLGAFEWSTIERVCRDCHLWLKQGDACPLSVNISSASLVTANFGLRVVDLMRRFGLPNEALVLELTEYDPVPDIDTVRDNVRVLTDHGIRLSLDDFGSGYSGLSVLARFQFSELKVDHTMIALIGNPRMRSAIELALASAQRYNATFVAEGVETWSQLDELHALGITQGQGHLFAREMSLEALMQFAAQRRLTAAAH